MVSISMAASDEYPSIPCSEKAEFVDPIIIKVVAVMSRIIPIVRNLRTNGVTSFLRCSVRIDKLYDNNANITMPAPIME
jgi:hypothetical protein